MTDSIETSEADAQPWAPDSEFPTMERLVRLCWQQRCTDAGQCQGIAACTSRALVPAIEKAPASTDPCSHLRGQILVLANLLGEALQVVKNVEAEGGDEAELLQHLITQGDAALAAVLQEHAMGRVSHG